MTVIKTCRRQALSLIEFFDQPMKAIVHSAFHTPFFNPSTLDLNPYIKKIRASSDHISCKLPV
ncbi:hypothetical protein [Trichormus azollae]|uniref:hypothetical protein n=1 Tax=Trichormus azollae TaxID=1164 RepID=UPI001180B704|nr:hypothetical protein [Trichormus azollae]